MTKEQEEAIKYLKESVLIYKNTIPKMSNTIDTVLSLIKAQQEEISNKIRGRILYFLCRRFWIYKGYERNRFSYRKNFRWWNRGVINE